MRPRFAFTIKVKIDVGIYYIEEIKTINNDGLEFSLGTLFVRFYFNTSMDLIIGKQ